MTISELIKRLEKLQNELGDVEVMILDGFNAGGNLRTINFGPIEGRISSYDHEETSDCEDRIGETIVKMGYGFY